MRGYSTTETNEIKELVIEINALLEKLSKKIYPKNYSELIKMELKLNEPVLPFPIGQGQKSEVVPASIYLRWNK